MSDISKEELQGLIDDVEFISSSIRKNASVIQQIAIHKTLRLTSLIAGISIIVLSIGFYWAVQKFGNFTDIPTSVKTVLFIGVGLSFVGVGIVKNVQFLHSAREIQPGISYWALLRSLHAQWMPLYYLPTAVVMITLLGYQISNGYTHQIVPTIAIGYGLMLNSFGAVLRVHSFIATAYWFLITGLISLFTPWISPFIAISYSVGIGMLFLWGISFVKSQKSA